MKYRIYIICLFAFAQSCNNVESCDINDFGLTTNDSIPKIKIQEGDTREKIIEKFTNQFGQDICYEELTFGLEIGSEAIKTSFTLYCPLKTSLIPPKPELSILINPSGQALLNNEIILKVDSIDNWILTQLQLRPNDEQKKKEIAIRWNVKTPINKFESAVHEIINGFKMKLNVISHEQFDRRFCDLSIEQALKVKSYFPHKFTLELESMSPPPPPPID